MFLFFTVPFISNFSEKFRSITKDINVRLSYRSLNKLSSFIKTHKDSLPTQNKRNVVYKINCSSCEVSYVGQTGRQYIRAFPNIKIKSNVHLKDSRLLLSIELNLGMILNGRKWRFWILNRFSRKD